MMKLFHLILCLLLSVGSMAQKEELLTIVFRDTSNFTITRFLDDSMPTRLYVLKATERWRTERFYLDEDLNSEQVRNKLRSDEHSYYNHTYLFKDDTLSSYFSPEIRHRLYVDAKAARTRELTDTFKTFRLFDSFAQAPMGFFFQVADPLFTTDQAYAFVDVSVHKKTAETDEINDSYYATLLLIYQRQKDGSWRRFKKRERIIL